MDIGTVEEPCLNSSEPKMLGTSKPRTSELSDQLLLKAKEELGETDEVREKALEELREWIENHQEKKYKILGNINILRIDCLV